MKKTYRHRKVKRKRSYHTSLLILALLTLLCSAIWFENDLLSYIKPGHGVRQALKTSAINAEDSLSSPVMAGATSNALTPSLVAKSQDMHDYQLPPEQDGMVPVISRVETQEKVAFLTIDDGIVTNPGDRQLMEANGMVATFFLVYRFIKNDQAFFGDLAQATGSDIENHSFDHYRLTNLSYDEQKLDICQNADIFSQLFGTRPALFRPSGGAYNDDTLRAAAACGQKVLIMWNATINNGVLRTQSGNHLHPGDIVLMHFRSTFSEDLMAFVAAAKDAGLHPALLVNWL